MITKDDPEWETLYKLWLEEKKPGWIIAGGKQYRVQQPSEDNVCFEPILGGIDADYASFSTKGIR